jgi:hypothetical protein
VDTTCRYTLQQINDQINRMDPLCPGALKWSSWWVVYDTPDQGVPPPAPSNINTMTNPEISQALYNCYCLGQCP